MIKGAHDRSVNDLTVTTRETMAKYAQPVPDKHVILTEDGSMYVGNGESMFDDLKPFYSKGSIDDTVEELGLLTSQVKKLSDVQAGHDTTLEDVLKSLDDLSKSYHSYEKESKERLTVIEDAQSKTCSCKYFTVVETFEAASSREYVIDEAIPLNNVMVNLSYTEGDHIVSAEAVARWQLYKSSRKLVVFNDYSVPIELTICLYTMF